MTTPPPLESHGSLDYPYVIVKRVLRDVTTQAGAGTDCLNCSVGLDRLARWSLHPPPPHTPLHTLELDRRGYCGDVWPNEKQMQFSTNK